MNRILVIGGTGTVGRQVLSRLETVDAQVRAMARNPGAARFPPEVEVVRGDLTLPEALDSCLEGIDSVFLVWTAPAAAVAPALERITKHARRIVFLSAPLKTAHPLFQQPNPLRAVGEQIERLIETSGLMWTFLRPGMFGGRRRFAPAMSCAGLISPPLRPRSTSGTSPQLRSGRCVRTDMPERNMF